MESVKNYEYWRQHYETLFVLKTLGTNLEAAATCAALYRLGYNKGFSDGTTLREFCEDYVPEPYFPSADSRPTAERLGWSSVS